MEALTSLFANRLTDTLSTLSICCLLLIPGFMSAQSNTFVEVFDEPEIVSMGVTLFSSRCDNKAFVPINLPENAKGWIYVVTIVTEEEDKTPVLLAQASELSSQHSFESIPDFIHQNDVKRSKDVNLVLLRSREVADKFYDCTYTNDPERYIPVSGRTGYVENTDGDPFFLGLEKYHNKRKLTVKVEVLAVM